jgi:hypothetical protein
MSLRKKQPTFVTSYLIPAETTRSNDWLWSLRSEFESLQRHELFSPPPSDRLWGPKFSSSHTKRLELESDRSSPNCVHVNRARIYESTSSTRFHTVHELLNSVRPRLLPNVSHLRSNCADGTHFLPKQTFFTHRTSGLHRTVILPLTS